MSKTDAELAALLLIITAAEAATTARLITHSAVTCPAGQIGYAAPSIPNSASRSCLVPPPLTRTGGGRGRGGAASNLMSWMIFFGALQLTPG